LDERAVLSIFEVKNRPSFDPLIIHTDRIEKLDRYVSHMPATALLLARTFWPGPLTLLLPKSDAIPDLVTSGLNQVAVRIPDHPLTLGLLSSLDYPLAAPSANPFGYISPTSPAHVDKQLGSKIPYILDGGFSGVGIESTIVGFPDGIPTIYRLGGLAIEKIVAVVGQVRTMAHSSSNPQAPGMLKSHYAPRKPLYLVDKNQMAASDRNQEALYLLLEQTLHEIPLDRQMILSSSGNLQEAAKNLFRYLRALDELPGSPIYAHLLPEEGLGRAINDRLRRAAADQEGDHINS
jgi:L-threonylcarbamoyladenylate synthase